MEKNKKNSEYTMKLQEINLADLRVSETNPRLGSDFKGVKFDELVESVKQSGILMPILVRKIKGGHYEIIAGSRRVAAAKAAGLKFAPAQVADMNDGEAREAQIVENLQRQDIHPLEEALAYRELIEQSEKRPEIKDIAARVGKSEAYIRQRLFLTNLEDTAAGFYRMQKLSDGQAAEVSKLEHADQAKLIKEARSGSYMLNSISTLKNWIKENISSPLKNQPWLKNETYIKVVGVCQECEPERLSLFGPVKNSGECTSLVCWERKMKLYINYRVKTEKLVRISTDYSSYAQKNGVIGRDTYVQVPKTGKARCKNAREAIVVYGSELGKMMSICTAESCPLHKGMKSQYGMTPKEQEKRREERKKEIAKAKKLKTAREVLFANLLAAVKWPLNDKALGVLVDMALDIACSNTMRSVAKRHALEIKKEKNTWGNSFSYDYGSAVKKFAASADKTEKARLVFELLADTGFDSLRKGIEKLF